MAAFDRALPTAWRFDTWACCGIVERVFGQWVRGAVHPRRHGRRLHVRRPDGAERVVDPIFGRYAVLLSVIGRHPRAAADHRPDHLGRARPCCWRRPPAPSRSIAALILYTLVQQVENNLLVPKIQGDAVELHPAAVMFAIIIGGALGGLIGAILALPVAAAGRDVVRYLFRRLGPDDPEALVAARSHGLGLGRHPGMAVARRQTPDGPGR